MAQPQGNQNQPPAAQPAAPAAAAAAAPPANIAQAIADAAAAAAAAAVAALQNANQNAQHPKPAAKKLENFSSADPAEWLLWRKNFELARLLNNWTHSRARLEASAAMLGRAKSYTQHIRAEHAPQGDPNLAEPVDRLLNQFEARFLPPAASDLAKVAVRTARQEEHETFQAWHARIQMLYQRAYPRLTMAEVLASDDLLEKFILGIGDKAVRARVHESRPATFEAALPMASNVAASKLLLATYDDLPDRPVTSFPDTVQAGVVPPGGVQVKQEPANYAIGQGQQRKGGNEKRGGSTSWTKPGGQECYACGRTNHTVKDCWLLERFKKSQARGGRSSSSRGGSRGRGGSSGRKSNGSSSRSNNSRRSIASVQSEEEERLSNDQGSPSAEN
jgi:uncharacterized membrane protein YgcG